MAHRQLALARLQPLLQRGRARRSARVALMFASGNLARFGRRHDACSQASSCMPCSFVLSMADSRWAAGSCVSCAMLT